MIWLRKSKKSVTQSEAMSPSGDLIHKVGNKSLNDFRMNTLHSFDMTERLQATQFFQTNLTFLPNPYKITIRPLNLLMGLCVYIKKSEEQVTSWKHSVTVKSSY